MKRGFLSFGMLAILGVICLAVAATLAFNTYLVKQPSTKQTPPTPQESSEGAMDIVCLQVITDAVNKKTGERKRFPNGCLPDGWESVN